LKIAVISDIHGNLTALQAILPAISKEVDKVVCLGDIASVGPQPHETIALLKRLNYPCVMGNTDESLWKETPEDFRRMGIPEAEARRMEALDGWTRSRITASDRKYLSTMKPTIALKAGGSSMLCYHGSPLSNTEGLLPATPDEELSRILSNRKATIFAGGHTHSQMAKRWRSSLIINPGSVGLPFQRDEEGRIRNPTWAEFAVVNFGHRELKVELCRVRYNPSKLALVVKESGMPDPDWWLADWI
jgi:putative phosphoesterase